MANEHSLEALNQEVRDIWNQKAVFWDEMMGEGNQFQRVLIGPASERLLDLQPNELVLEVGCGNGVFTRRMAHLGVHVVAFDFSEQFIQRAKAREDANTTRIEYLVLDATNESELSTLGQDRFDAIVCNMALMDMTTIDPLLSALRKLLKHGGHFVFSVMHPCFNAGSSFVLEADDRGGELVETYAIKVSHYLSITPQKGTGIIGEPVPHYYFHRPLHALLNTCFQAGFVLDGLEEPAFGPADSGRRALSWANFKEIPPVLVARMRLP